MLDIDIDLDVDMDLVTNHLPNLQDLHLAMTWERDIAALLENLPEVLERMHGNLHNTADQSSKDIQRQVLRRLEQQKRLQKLVLGGAVSARHTLRYSRQFSCLEMTLESGLDELASLTDLEELDIHHKDHRVGKPELEWMA
ncbi:hypothetical protein BGW42_007863 [Actinomortierella wolfii]|nr:hypothetical protein BGW42_007863 [Actinomortierella wolfii]